MAIHQSLSGMTEEVFVQRMVRHIQSLRRRVQPEGTGYWQRSMAGLPRDVIRYTSRRPRHAGGVGV